MIIDRDTSPEKGVPEFILPTSCHVIVNRRKTFHVVNGEGEEEDKNY